MLFRMCASFIMLFLMFFSMVSGVGAINLSNQYNNDIYTMYDDFVDVDTFSPASKIAYESVFVLGLNVRDYPPNMHTFTDLVNFFNNNNISAVAVQTTPDSLKPGDIIQSKNSDFAFLVYMGTNASSGNIILEDLYHQFECTPEEFEVLFTGNAVLINHRNIQRSVLNTVNVNDSPIHDQNIHAELNLIGLSLTGTIIGTYAQSTFENNPIIKEAIKNMGGTTGTEDRRARAIFTWMHGGNGPNTGHIKYHSHRNTEHTLEHTLNFARGNCCEQARIVVGFARAMGLTAQFVHTVNHVFSRVKVNGSWVYIDTTTANAAYGQNRPPTAIYSDYLSF
jgi:Transglutaminase-like superfamily